MYAAKELTALDITTLVLAVIGALTGVASLAWAIALHALTGARVKVELVVGWVAAGNVISLPWQKFDPSQPPPVSGVDIEYAVAGVEVRNVGRLPCTVQGWSIALDNGATLSHVTLPINPPLPHRLDVGEQQTWYADLDPLLGMITVLHKSNMPPKAVFGRAQLGDGRKAESKRFPAPR